MSLLKSRIAVAAALSASLTVMGKTAEQLLNNIAGITAMRIIETDDRGACVVFFAVGADVKVITDAKGDVRVFGDASSALGAVKRAGVGSGVAVTIRKFDPVVSVGSPLKSLINSHKFAKREAATAAVNLAAINVEKGAAEAQNWNLQVGTPKRAEYDDIAERSAIVNEWKAATDASVIAFAASLTAAGISPITYLAI